MVALNPYGAALDSTASAISAGNLASGQNIVNAMTNSGTSVFRYLIEWNGIERAVQTTSTTAVSSTGTHTITLSSVPANFVVGLQVFVEPSVSSRSFTISAD